MVNEIIVAVCSLVGTALGAFGGLQLTNFRLKQLEEKVNKHNKLVERMAVAENKLAFSDSRIANLESEVRTIERGIGKIDKG